MTTPQLSIVSIRTDEEARKDAARLFLVGLDRNAKFFSFQTFDDNKERAKAYKKKHKTSKGDPHYTKVLHGTLEQCWDELVKFNERGSGVYVTVNETDGKGREIKNIKRVRAVMVDLDGEPLQPVLDWEYKPHLVVETSERKYHGYWLVEFLALDEFQATQEALNKKFAADPSVKDLPRVMRLPGFHHMKDASRPFMVRNVKEHSNPDLPLYTDEQLRKELHQAAHGIEVATDGGLEPDAKYGPIDYDGLALRDLKAWVPKLFGSKATPYKKGYRVSSVDLGRDNDEDLGLQPEGCKDFGVHDLGDEKSGKRQPIEIIMTYGGAPDKHAATVWLCNCLGIEPPPRKSVVLVKSGYLVETADMAEKVLLEAKVPIYQRAHTLVYPIVADADAAFGRKTKTARFSEVDTAWLRSKLGRHAQFKKYSKDNKLLPIDPPKDVVVELLARKDAYPYKPVNGIITTPTLRQDGSLLIDEGYDESTGLLLVTPMKLPDIPETPTRDDALKALKLLSIESGLLNEFPLVDKVSESVALSGIITPVVRGAFPLCPMHAARAPVAGTGKSYMWDVAAMIATGRFMPVMAAGNDDKETDKRLGASLLAGDPMISIDNVNSVLGSDTLNQATERPLVKIRILGLSEQPMCDTRGITFYCTGNNISFRGDMNRRVITACLDPMVERPELRRFRGNPVKDVVRDRGKYVAACLTIVRAYIAAGRPGCDEISKLASFEGWSDTVRSALVWLGCADPVSSIESMRAEDSTLNELRDVLMEWSRVFGVGKEHRLTSLELRMRACETDAVSREQRWPQLFEVLRAVAKARPDGIDLRTLKYWLRGRNGRVVSGLKINNVRNSATNQAEWWIESISGTVKQGCYTPFRAVSSERSLERDPGF